MAPGGASLQEKEAMAASKSLCSDDEQLQELDETTQLVCVIDDNHYELIAFANPRLSGEPPGVIENFEITPMTRNLPLNTKQLKELLDEAINYKNPKDRVGKSKVFLDLLSEAEIAERAGEDLATRGRRSRASESNVAGGSLQNISQAVESDSHSGTRRRHKQYRGAGGSVSARQREGGSLPCNVNAGWTCDLRKEGEKREQQAESSGIACPGPSGTLIRRETMDRSKPIDAAFVIENADLPESNSFPPQDRDSVDGRIMNPENFRTGRRHSDDRVVNATGPNLHYDAGAGPSHIDDYHSHHLFRTSASLEVGDEFPEAAHMNGTDTCDPTIDRGFETSMHRRTCKMDGRCDEGASTSKAACSKKSNKRKNADKNVALSRKSEEMPGYRGDMDLDTLLNFIENDGKIKAMRKQLSKQKIQEKKQKDMQKASSLEELSQRNIKDLTESCKTDRWADQVLLRSESQNEISTRMPEQKDVPIYDQDDSNDSEFQMVRKKHRRRREADSGGKRVRRRGANQRSPRRKSTSSVPPSERSAESDLDSVHSLPAHGAHASDSDCDSNGPPPLKTQIECKLRTEDFPCLPVKPDITKHDFTKNETVGKQEKNSARLESGKLKSDPKSAPAAKIEPPKGAGPKDCKPNSSRPDSSRTNPNYKQPARSDVGRFTISRHDPPLKTYPSPKTWAMRRELAKNSIAPAKSPPTVIQPACNDVVKQKEDEGAEEEEGGDYDAEADAEEEEDAEDVKQVKGETGEKIKEAAKTPPAPPDDASLPAVALKPTAFEAPPARHQATRAEHKIDVKPKTRSKSVGPNTRPPVILMNDRRSHDSTPCELIFGFEVNMQLLSQGDKDGKTEKLPQTSQPESVNATQKNTENVSIRKETESIPLDVSTTAAAVPQPEKSKVENREGVVTKPQEVAIPHEEQDDEDASAAALSPPKAGFSYRNGEMRTFRTPTGTVRRRLQHLHRPGVDYTRPDAPIPFYVISDYVRKPDASQTSTANNQQTKNDSASCTKQPDTAPGTTTKAKDQPECAACAVAQVSGNCPIERRTSDVMTSTEDLETVMASQQSVGRAIIPPVAESPAEILEDEERYDCKGEEEWENEEPKENGGNSESDTEYDSEEEDERLRRENPYYPYANKEHYDLVLYNKALWEKAVNSPDTIWYEEPKKGGQK